MAEDASRLLKGRTRKVATLLGAGLGLVIALANGAGLLDGWHRDWSAYLFRVRGERPADQRIVVVGITGACLYKVARWPWPRGDLARLVRRLHEGGALAIGLDLPLFESDRLDRRGEEALARAIAKAGNVYLSVEAPGRFLPERHGQFRYRLTRPCRRLAGSALGLGHVMTEQSDVLRWAARVPGSLFLRKERLPSLAARLAARAGEPVRSGGGIAYSGALGSSISLIPAWKILSRTEASSDSSIQSPPGLRKPAPSPRESGKKKGEERGAGRRVPSVAGKLVLVGGTARGLFPLYRTPYGLATRVEVQASILHTLLGNRALRTPGVFVVAILLILFGAILGWGGAGTRVIAVWIWALALLLFFFVLSLWSIIYTRYLVPGVPVALTILALATALSALQWHRFSLSFGMQRARLDAVSQLIPVITASETGGGILEVLARTAGKTLSLERFAVYLADPAWSEAPDLLSRSGEGDERRGRGEEKRGEGEERGAPRRVPPVFRLLSSVGAEGAPETIATEDIPIAWRDESLWRKEEIPSDPHGKLPELGAGVVWQPVRHGGRLAGVVACGADGELESAAPEFALAMASVLSQAARTSAAVADLERTRKLNETVLETLPTAVFVFDDDRRLLFVNPAGENLLGRRDEGGCVGQEAADLFAPIPALKSAFENYGEEPGASKSTEISFEDARRGRRWAKLVCMPLERDSQAFGHVCLVEELTRIRALYESARKSDRLASLGRFAAGIVHEVKNPLQAIRTSTEIVRMSIEGEEDRDLADTVLQEVDRLMTLLQEILGFSRPQTSGLLEEVDVAALLEQALNMAGPVLRKQGIEIERAFAEAVPTIRSHGQRLTQVFLNLLNNAAEVMPDGGRLVVDLRAEEGQVLVAVTDTGPGVPKEQREAIFEPFVTTRAGGTGLGLFLVESYLHEVGGDVRIASSSDEGTTMVVSLPVLVV